MNWFWMNIPLAAAFFLAWILIPLWMVIRHPDANGPDSHITTVPDPIQAAPPTRLRVYLANANGVSGGLG